MSNQKKHSSDTTLEADKRDRHRESRVQVAQGQRTQESMFLISPKAAKASTVRHRVISFE